MPEVDEDGDSKEVAVGDDPSNDSTTNDETSQNRELEADVEMAEAEVSFHSRGTLLKDTETGDEAGGEVRVVESIEEVDTETPESEPTSPPVIEEDIQSNRDATDAEKPEEAEKEEDEEETEKQAVRKCINSETNAGRRCHHRGGLSGHSD